MLRVTNPQFFFWRTRWIGFQIQVAGTRAPTPIFRPAINIAWASIKH
jgi:hypothetical protein